MNIATYNSIYELFAGVSSGIVGLQVIRTFILSKMESFFVKHSERLTPKIQQSQATVAQYIEFYNFYDRLRTSAKFSAGFHKALGLQTWYLRTAESMTVKNEGEMVDRKLLALSIHTFLYCVAVIIIGGLVQDKFLEPIAGFKFMGNLNTFSIISSCIITFWVKKRQSYAIRIAATCIAMVFGIVIGLQNIDWFFMKKSPSFIIGCSFVICVLPFIIMLFRVIWWSLFSDLEIGWKLKSTDKSDRVNKAFLNGIVDEAILA